MKIAIVGSHGVGKTTLSSKLSKILNLPLIPDVAVEAYRKGFTISENTPPEIQFWMFAKHLEYERGLGENWIADKCLIDYSVYADVLFTDTRVTGLLAEMTSRNAYYDFVFYLPIEFPIEDDGVRSLDVNFQKNVDDRYKQVLDQWNVSYITLTGSIENRVKQAANHIIDHHLNK
jgi:nicotinamide riboside kinase